MKILSNRGSCDGRQVLNLSFRVLALHRLEFPRLGLSDLTRYAKFFAARHFLSLYLLMSGSARGPNGQLLDESQIAWYFDADDNDPIPASTMTSSNLASSSRPQRAKFPTAKLTAESGIVCLE